MKIISLRFANLNSLQGEWFIDFSAAKFVDNGLFAITGPTGAGKTTLLDAICLALYHQTPRLGIITANNNDIMSRGTANCCAEVVFEVSNSSYRAFWSMRRARNAVAGKLQGAECELTQVSTGDKDRVITTRIDEKIKKIESLTSLNFDRFNKSMMLSQGKFAEFLNASENDRAGLLEELTGTEIYSRISMLVHQQYGESKRTLEIQKEKAGAYQLLSEETLKQLKEDQDDKHTRLKTLEHNISDYQQYLSWHIEFHKAQTGLNKWQNEAERVKQDYEALSELRNSHHLAKAASKLQPQFEKLEQLKNNQMANAQQISLCNTQIERQKTELDALSSKHQVSSDALKNKEKEQEAQQSYIRSTVQVQDEKLKRIEEALFKRCKQQTEIADKLEQQNKLLAKNQKRKTELFNELSQVKTTFSQHENILLLADELNEWQANARQLKRLTQQNAKAQQTFDENNALIAELNHQIQDISSRLKATEEDLQAHRLEATRLQNNLQDMLQFEGKSLTVNELSAQHKRRVDLLKALPNLRMIQARYIEVLQRIEQHQKNDSRLKQEAEEEQSKLLKLNEDLAQKQQSLSDVNALLTQEETLSEYRKRLQPNEPCMLCGSKDHPFTHSQLHKQKQDNLVDVSKTTERKALLTSETQALENACQTKHQSLESIKVKLEFTENELIGDQALQQNYSEQWENNSQQQASDIAVEDKLSFETYCKALHSSVDSFEKLGLEVEEAKKLVKTNEQAIDKIKGEKRVLEKEHEAKLFNLTRIEKENETHRQTFEDLNQEIHCTIEIFSQAFTEYKLTDELLILNEISSADTNAATSQLNIADKQIDELSTALEEKHKRIQEAKIAQQQTQRIENELNTLQSPEAVLQSRINELELTLRSLENDITDSQKELSDETEIRASMLDGKSIDDALKEQRTSLAKARQDEKETALQYQAELKRETQLSATLSLLHTNAETLSSELKSEQKSLDDALATSIFSDLESFESALVSDDELESMSQTIQEAEDERKDVTSRVSTFKQSLDDVLNSYGTLPHLDDIDAKTPQEFANKNIDDLQALITMINQQKDQLLTEQGEINNKITQDEQTRRAQADTLKRIELLQDDFEELGLLNSLIGSAKGDNFRKFAQGLTLDHLIYLANYRLRQLHGRYELTRLDPSSLSLAVCDTWQADTRRNTKTLSGGESFLVSLALALGLSDLVSNKISIDSLFLDEGFGTLDGATLDIALNALEQLNASGKMIGVISHIDAMKERIPIQIAVNKEAGAGISKLDPIYQYNNTQR